MQRSEMQCEWNGTNELRKKVKRMKAGMWVGILEQSKCALRLCVQDQRCYFVALSSIKTFSNKKILARISERVNI